MSVVIALMASALRHRGVKRARKGFVRLFFPSDVNNSCCLILSMLTGEERTLHRRGAEDAEGAQRSDLGQRWWQVAETTSSQST